MTKVNLKNQQGIIAIISLLGVSVLALAIIGTLAVIAIGEYRFSGSGSSLEETYYQAEAGLNDALYRLIKNPNPQPQPELSFAGGKIEVTIDVNPDNKYQRIIRSTTTDESGRVRSVEIIANTSGFGSGFDYAVQGGAEGIYLDNNSVIIGHAYSNSNILPASSGARGEIQGSAFAVGLINKIDITGNASVYSITNSNVTGNVYHESSLDNSNTIGGQSIVKSAPKPIPLPLSDADIQDYISNIQSSGNEILTPNSDDCPKAYDTGTYCVMSNTTLGQQEIDGDLYIDNGKTLTINGHIYVTGKIILDNNGIIAVANRSSLETNFTIKDDNNIMILLIAEGIINVSPNFTIQGLTNDPSDPTDVGAYIIAVSLNSSLDPNSPAVYASNNSDSIVFAAINGVLKVKNNGTLNAAAAQKLYLEPNSVVTYDISLSGFVIPAGGSTQDPIGTALGTWDEL